MWVDFASETNGPQPSVAHHHIPYFSLILRNHPRSDQLCPRPRGRAKEDGAIWAHIGVTAGEQQSGGLPNGPHGFGLRGHVLLLLTFHWPQQVVRAVPKMTLLQGGVVNILSD